MKVIFVCAICILLWGRGNNLYTQSNEPQKDSIIQELKFKIAKYEINESHYAIDITLIIGIVTLISTFFGVVLPYFINK